MARRRESHAFTTVSPGLTNVLRNKVSVRNSEFLPENQRPQIQCSAIWDTGAEKTTVTSALVAGCGLVPVGKAHVYGVNDVKPQVVNKYVIDLLLPNNVIFKWLEVLEAPRLSGGDVLIGMDIINAGDFAVSNHAGRTVFNFRLPSVRDIMFVPPRSSPRKKIGRNEPCPCGSGVKYKNCHGM